MAELDLPEERGERVEEDEEDLLRSGWVFYLCRCKKCGHRWAFYGTELLMRRWNYCPECRSTEYVVEEIVW